MKYLRFELFYNSRSLCLDKLLIDSCEKMVVVKLITLWAISTAGKTMITDKDFTKHYRTLKTPTILLGINKQQNLYKKKTSCMFRQDKGYQSGKLLSKATSTRWKFFISVILNNTFKDN